MKGQRMMRVQPSTRILSNHPPQEYYELWAQAQGLDLQKFPYLKQDLAEPNGRLVPFAVFDFDIAKDEVGNKLALAFIRYKSLFSKHEFVVQAYL